VRQIPLPIPCQPDFGAQNSAAKIFSNLTQVIDIIGISGCLGRFQDAEKADFPAIREDTATRRRGAGVARG
jgi:hypothetical protein